MLALWAIRDADGHFSCASEHAKKKPEREALAATEESARRLSASSPKAKEEAEGEAATAMQKALDKLHDPKKWPPAPGKLLCWLFTAPGKEEAALKGMHRGAQDGDAKLPEKSMPVVFGSTSADEHTKGMWWQLAGCPGSDGGSWSIDEAIDPSDGVT